MKKYKPVVVCSELVNKVNTPPLRVTPFPQMTSSFFSFVSFPMGEHHIHELGEYILNNIFSFIGNDPLCFVFQTCKKWDNVLGYKFIYLYLFIMFFLFMNKY